ncbi:MAG: autotransporter domain-containing protein [Alphaproteobacteria bacterium]|nr:autotransporter domain-containing protein [Alphaproteobacteria bacterium]
MRYTRTVIGLLSNQYKSVLKKCLMINLGIFAYIGTANATYNLNDAVADAAAEREYVLQEDENVAATLGTMGGTSATLTIDGSANKYGINADPAAPAAVGGITVGAGNTLILKNLGSYTVSGEGTAVTDYTVNSSVNGFVGAAGGFLNNSGTATISDVVFSNNNADNGGAVYNSGKITGISNTTFINNKVKSYGGTIYNSGGEIGDILTTDFVGNKGSGAYLIYGTAINNIANSKIGNISGRFIGNEINSNGWGAGVAIYNDNATIGNISAEFYANSIVANDSVMGTVIFNDSGSKMEDISGSFIGNSVTGQYYILGGVINNGYTAYSTIGNISADFKNNSIHCNGEYCMAVGSIIENGEGQGSGLGSKMGNIFGNFENNTAEANFGVFGGIYNDVNTTIGDITANFKDNTTTSDGYVYGFIANDGGTINKIDGSNFENNEANGAYQTLGSAIYNNGTITEGVVNATFSGNSTVSGTEARGGAIYTATDLMLTNTKFTDNRATGSAGSTVSGGAIYTKKNLTVIADGSIGDGISTFQGNYVQVGNEAKDYQAVFVSGATNTLIFEAKNGGTINLYDYVIGSSGYTTTITGDSTGTLNLYNDIKSSNVSIEKVDISTADGTLHDYEFLSLTPDANVKWNIDIDTKNQTADNFATDANATSSGTVTINELNYVDSSQSDIVEGFKVQVLKTQGDETAADLQLALSDDLKEEFVISETENTHTDEVTANTKWSDEFKKTGTITTTSGQYGLATTDTLNDSIGATVTSKSEQIDEKAGDTLAMVNQAELSDKNFTADKADEVYNAEDDLGATYGNVTINGVASGDKKSTVDLDGHNGFVVGEGTSIALNNAKLTDSAGKAEIEIADGGNISLQNSELSGVNLNVNGEFDAAENEVSAKNATFGKNSTLKLLVNNIKDDHGAFKADSFDIAQGATLDVTFGQNPLDGAKFGEVALLSLNDGSDIDNNNFSDEFHNNMYKFVRKSEKSGIYGVYQTKTAEEISQENGGTKTNQEAAAAWVDGPSFAGGTAAKIADGLADLAQNNGASFNEALTALAPNDDGMVQAVSADINDRLLLTIDNHLVEASKEEGLSSGDNGKNRGYPDLSGVKTWIKAYYGEAKLQRRGDIYGFNSDSRGFIAGVDKKVASTVKAGIGMQYDDTDIDAFERDGDAKTLLGFVYGEYRPSNWFVNAALAYGVTDYDEDKTVVGQKVAAHYKAEMYSLQGLAGYTFKYFTPEIGARYYQIRRHGYTDSALQSVSGNNMDLLRATAGVKAETTYGMFKPHAYVGILYDLVSDRDTAIVNLTNGAGYTVHGKRLPRFGVEIGAGVSANLNDHIELGLGYEAKFRKDYQDHSGILNFKYNF